MKNSSVIKTIEEYIDYYSKNLSDDEYMRELINRKYSEEELDIINDISSGLNEKCVLYKEGKIAPKEIEKYASTIMYKKYNPNLLYEILSRELYDFLMLLDEFTFYLEKEN